MAVDAISAYEYSKPRMHEFKLPNTNKRERFDKLEKDIEKMVYNHNMKRIKERMSLEVSTQEAVTTCKTDVLHVLQLRKDAQNKDREMDDFLFDDKEPIPTWYFAYDLQPPI